MDVRFVDDAAGLGRPDLVILPGTKATVADLAWLRDAGPRRGRRPAAGAHRARHLRRLPDARRARIDDEVESALGQVDGLGLLAVTTRFERGQGHPAAVRAGAGPPRAPATRSTTAGCGPRAASPSSCSKEARWTGCATGRYLGTTLHGLLEVDELRRALLLQVATRAGKAFVPAEVSFEALRQARLDRLADVLEEHLDLGALSEIVTAGRTAVAS